MLLCMFNVLHLQIVRVLRNCFCAVIELPQSGAQVLVVASMIVALVLRDSRNITVTSCGFSPIMRTASVSWTHALLHCYRS
jgi:hypothetical protein